MVEKAYERAVKLLRENREKLEKLATRLLEKEVIFSEDLEEIFGKRPWDEDKRPGENDNGDAAVDENVASDEKKDGPEAGDTATLTRPAEDKDKNGNKKADPGGRGHEEDDDPNPDGPEKKGKQ